MNWLLLRGLAREQRHWGEFKSKLHDLPFVDEVLCLDLPGFGEAVDEESPLTIEEITDNLREKFLDKAEENDTWGICAISLGGMIAMDWLSRFPKDFEVAKLMNTSSANYSAPWKRFKGYNFIHPGLLRETDFSIHDIEKMILATISNRYAHSEAVLNEWVKIRESCPYDPLDVAKQLAAGAIFYAQPERIHQPVLLLCSAQDRLVDTSCTLNLAKDFKNAYINIHPTGGHEISLDEPDWVCEKMASRFGTKTVD
ncbi:MAG: alpha/beta hydrolase [Bdellovibrionales bacterium]